MKKMLWFPIMIFAIPIDFIFWNLTFGTTYGFRTLKECMSDNWKQWKQV